MSSDSLNVERSRKHHTRAPGESSLKVSRTLRRRSPESYCTSARGPDDLPCIWSFDDSRSFKPARPLRVAYFDRHHMSSVFSLSPAFRYFVQVANGREQSSGASMTERVYAPGNIQPHCGTS